MFWAGGTGAGVKEANVQERDYVEELQILRYNATKRVSETRNRQREALLPVLEFLKILQDAGEITVEQEYKPKFEQTRLILQDADGVSLVEIFCVQALPYPDLRTPINWLIRVRSDFEEQEDFTFTQTHQPVIESILQRIAEAQARYK